jgi:hypothetical protein
MGAMLISKPMVAGFILSFGFYSGIFSIEVPK